MLAYAKILTGTAGLALAVGAAAPAAAQYGYGYPGGGNVVGQVVNQVLGGRYGGYGYNGYNSSTQVGVQQCAIAVERRINGGYGGQGYGYGGQGYGGYGSQGYGGQGGYGAYGGGRVVAITHADRHSRGRVKVKGVATSGMAGGYGGGHDAYGGHTGYGGQGGADLSFNCTVEYNGAISHLDIDRNRNTNYRGY